jgi:hypothetical protein
VGQQCSREPPSTEGQLRGRRPALTEIDTRWRGSFGYFTVLVGPEKEHQRIPLAASGTSAETAAPSPCTTPPPTLLHPQLLRTGRWEGSPDDAFETPAHIHLAGHEARTSAGR